MPPRRSTRQSLPTPAASIASSANSPNTGKRGTMTTTNGLVTPISLSDGDVEDMIEVGQHQQQEESEEREVTPKVTRGKRKAPASTDTEDESVFADATSSAKPTSSANRFMLDSVTLPSRRSRLGQEQTGSLENLTLGSPVSKKPRLGQDVLKSEPDGTSDPLDVIDSVPSTASKRASRAKTSMQPFNVGKYSRVAKASASDLALDDDEKADVKPTRPRRSVGTSAAAPSTTTPSSTSKGKGRGKAATAAVKDEVAMKSESEYEADTYALNSEDEEHQLKAAIKASAAKGAQDKFGSASSTAVTSRASSVGGGKGKNGKANGSGAKRETVGRRAAVLRSAEKRRNARKVKEFSFDTDADDSDDSGSEFNESDLSDAPSEDEAQVTPPSSDEDDDDNFSDADVPLAKGKGRGKKVTPKTKSKGKKAFTKKFAGKGRKLGDSAPASDEDDDDEDDDDDDLAEEDLDALDDDETRIMTLKDIRARKRKERKENEERMLPIKKEEARMKKELGRKLTNGEKNIIRLVRHHPELVDVWGDLAANIPPVKPEVMDAHPSLKLQLLPFQKESLYWMRKQEEGVWKGGMLADEMGMGKTIQTIALLLSEPRRKPSLVVAPVVALMQWKHEIENNTDGFTVCVWHGQGRMKAAELKKYDVVLSSYGTLEAAFRRQQRGFKRGDVFIKEKSPMHSFEWYRVILDEAHNIKERSTNAAKAAFALQAQYKWCLSGTPLQNRVGELYSLVRFLGADPFSHYFCKKCDCKSLHWKFSDKRHCDQCKHKPMDHVCFWNTEILTPIARYGIEAGGPGHTAFKKLKILLDRMMLRRTKLERADDLGLPPRTIVVRRDYFSPEEKELYMSLFSGAKRTFATYVDQGTVLNNYSNIFSLITRMRQMACHPDLVLRSKTSSLKAVDVSEGSVCRLCQDTAEDAIVSACKHVFDRECIRQYLEVQQLRGHRPECPVCHIEISIDLEQEAIEIESDSKKARQGILSRLDLNKWRSSSKLEALVEELEKLRNKDCTIKSLVFSQFVSFLDLIAFRLQRAGFNICRLEGGMTPQQRDATIQHFMNNTNVTVFLISLKAGGVALNLTEASMVFMMDSWWNPSVEYQAMDRIHRLGQKRPVKVVKLVVEDSIEDQIVQLQHKKLAMTEAALNKDPDAALGKLTVEDLGFLFKM